MPSTQPVWQEIPDDRAFRSPLPATADVCVVGAGIAGLTVAYHLALNGKKVVVVDARSVGSGMTSCTTAHLASAIDDRFANLIRRRGEDVAFRSAHAHVLAIDTIERIVADEEIDCGFARVSGFLVAASPDDGPLLQEEAAAARKLGIEVERLAKFPLAGFNGGECLRFSRQARFEPMAYLGGLARAVVRHSGTIATGTRVRLIEDGSPVKVTMDDGFELRATAVVVATNSPVNDRVRMHTKQFPYMTYAIGLQVPAGLPDALIWDTLDPYHYCRLAGKPGPDGADTLIVGGEDHKTGQASDGEKRFADLEAWAHAHFPAAGRVTHKWAGQVLETLDGLAHIGRNPGDENVYIVTGDSGMGMTHGTIAGLLIPSLIAGEDHPWKEAFDPGRTPVRGASEFVSENANVAWQYAKDYLAGSEVDSLDEIEPESGAVVRSGLTKVAVYRDEKGDLHKCSAICPHLGAVVHWNAAEKSWDCPAHGSRFDCQGRVIQGPANVNLTPVQETANTK